MPTIDGTLVQGTINVDMSAIDSFSSSGVTSEKKLKLSSATLIPNGYVILKTGTVGTTAVTFGATPLDFGYVGSDGEISLAPQELSGARSSVIAFSAEPEAVLVFERLSVNEQTFAQVVSVDGNVAVSSVYGGPPPGGFSPDPIFTVSLVPGTTVTSATYTVIAMRTST
jgi:hypothetical protein